MSEPAAPPSAAAAAPTGGGAPSAQPAALAPGAALPKMPDGLPVKYWDNSSGIKTDEIVKDFIGAQPVLTAHQARLAARPEKADGYKSDLPEDFVKSLPKGVEIKFDPKDPVRGPVLIEAQALAHELGLDQPTFSKLLALQGKLTVAENAAFAKAETERAAGEVKKLGENYPARKTAVDNFINSALSGDDKAKAAKATALAGIVTDAAAFEAVEDLIARANGTRIPGGQPNTVDPPKPPQQSIEDRWYGGSQQKAS